jgi:hypoxanthine phosphoribosyltransferase
MEDKKKNILIDADKINGKVKELGAQISEDYLGKKLYILSLLRGSFIFTADLARNITLTTKIGFMTTSSYGDRESTSGHVNMVYDIPDSIIGWDVLIVDDIIDTGTTMKFVKDHIEKLGANSVKSCVLLDKPERRIENITPDYCCFEIPDLFVVGYGLNYGDFYRNVPYIFNWE